MHTAIIAIGSNLGPSRRTIANVLRYWETRWGQPLQVSPLYRSEPMYDLDQPAYVNGVFRTSWEGDAFSLLAALLDTEARFGRVRDPNRRFGARSIDLDLIDLGGVVLDSATLTLPHPRMHERPFVLRPLADLDPTWTHPILGTSVIELRKAVSAEEDGLLALQDDGNQEPAP